MFEGMLARKYIGSQKRHSALTICSIAIALALITMLFTIFPTAIGILRNIAYERGAYHIKITGIGAYWVDKEQCDAIEEAASEYGSVTVEEYWQGTANGIERRYRLNILFDRKINHAALVMHDISQKTGIERIRYDTNDLLILCDMADDQSLANMAAIIASFYVFVMFLIMLLRLIIDTAFEISSKERERQFGVLQSIGATPKQIVRIITYEGMMLSVIGIPLGVGLGIGLGYAVYRAVLGTRIADLYLSPSKAQELVHFVINPWLLLLGVVTGAVWVFLSAYGTGMRVIKMSPVQAISQRVNTVKKAGKALLFGKLFGWTGKMASRNNMRRPKRFVVSVVSLTLSIALFSAVTVVISDLKKAAEDYYGNFTGQGDFIVDMPYRGEDPLAYRKDLNTLEECDLFEDVPFSLRVLGRFYIPEAADADDSGEAPIYVNYLNRNSYNNLFGGKPPVSYDELAESGGYIAGSPIADHLNYVGGSDKSISLTFYEGRIISYSEEEYNALPPEEQEKCWPSYSRDENGNVFLKGYRYNPAYTVDFDIYYTTEHKSEGLIATLDQYENGDHTLYKNTIIEGGDRISLDLVDDDDYYYNALDFFEENSISYSDNTAENRQLHAILASVNIAAAFLSIMIALVAVVNMVNILTTGILNRRGELAAMQCAGMTEKQLYKMTAIECLQYALTSGIAAVVVCELMMFLTEKMLHIVLEIMEYLGDFISYVQPLPIIAIASLCAFIIAVAASIIPLRAMRKTSLVEQIRSVE